MCQTLYQTLQKKEIYQSVHYFFQCLPVKEKDPLDLKPTTTQSVNLELFVEMLHISEVLK